MRQTDQPVPSDRSTGPVIDEPAAPEVPAPRSSAEAEVPQAGPVVRRNRLAALDGLRFLAALAVVLFHFVGQTPGAMEFVWGRPPGELFPEAHRYFAFGRLGVDLFFLISGFVICMSAWGRTPRDFFISRVTRLYPMYWVAIIVSASVIYLFDTPFGHPNPRMLFANFTMLQTPLGVDNLDSVYWTLWPELCFYLTFAVVVWKGLTYQRVVIFCGLWTVAAVLAPSAGIPLLTLLVNPTSAPFFIAGMAFYLMYRYRPTPLLWGIVAMSWLLALHFLLAPHGGRNNWDTWAPWRGWLIVSTTVFFLLIAAIALGWTTWIRGRWLTVAGTLTFPLYLLHDVIGVTILHRFGDHVDPWTLVLALTGGLIVLSYVVQRLVERPIAQAMRRLLSSAEFGLKAPSVRRH
ncbi:acyltransferase family protein [Streptomyces rochei]|uniref:Acyltransferase family protein n=1 Tax=Streptomyces rochei TaxID=1928 RepID=A0ABW7E152_STRRO|nr:MULTISPECIES: acyltransferase [Streptomyces]MBX4177728.1 acyltransferase [Streptomyces geysiriensis]RSS13029.1 acyltransferase [Streptomyces sp. WAC08401]MBQ0911793.1 acyltransferase [Streptomyces sp. RM99]MCC8449510.1 acyltransferase [Streptomyces rochei]NUV92346.1 acyltransferase [Streptomyces sp. KAI 90]